MSADELKIFQAKVREKKGSMAINFDKVMKDPNSPENIYLHNKDSIVVYKKNNFINVQGRVANPGQVSYNPNFQYQDYIALAGGYGYRADESETLISKPFGGLFSAEDSNYKLEPGDVILVPPKKDLTFGEVALQVLTVATQLVTIAGVVIAIVNLTNNSGK
jgi:protein involved in polysaccharide export with SLBB domain